MPRKATESRSSRDIRGTASRSSATHWVLIGAYSRPHIALSVEHVILERDDPSMATVTQQVIPLDLYFKAEPDPMAGYADSITAHTNTHHQPQLRAFIAARVGLDVGHVAGAALNELDRFGAQLAWVDSAGAHIMALRFAESARTPAMLSCLLRSHLDHHHDCDRP